MNSFSELSLSSEVNKAILDLKYEKPSAIQAQALPILLGETTDFLGLAATGTGKTAAFAIPLIERIDVADRSVQAIILCPTRELALQVCNQINALSKYKDISTLAVYGGASYTDQIRSLKSGVHIVVGTPGRMVDHLERGTLQIGDVHTVILDEADEMISMGFKEDLEFILDKTDRETSNIWLFSATMSRDVRRVADEYLRNPQQVQVNRTEMVPTSIEQIFYRTREGNKPEVLQKIIDVADDFYGLVFCQTKNAVMDLTQYLIEKGYNADCLHGDKDQRAREKTLQAFRDKKAKILVCTDVASRGIDIQNISHVINYSLPRELDSYVHRIGRTARSGKTGIAISLVTPSHMHLVTQIERLTKSKITEGKIPGRKEIGEKKISQVLPKFQKQTHFLRATSLLDESWQEALQDMSAEEVAGRFLTLMFPEVFQDEVAARATSRVKDDSDGSRAPRQFKSREQGSAPRERQFGSRPRGRGDSKGGRSGGFGGRGDFSGRSDSRDRADSRGTRDSRERRFSDKTDDFGPFVKKEKSSSGSSDRVYGKDRVFKKDRNASSAPATRSSENKKSAERKPRATQEDAETPKKPRIKTGTIRKNKPVDQARSIFKNGPVKKKKSYRKD